MSLLFDGIGIDERASEHLHSNRADLFAFVAVRWRNREIRERTKVKVSARDSGRAFAVIAVSVRALILLCRHLTSQSPARHFCLFIFVVRRTVTVGFYF